MMTAEKGSKVQLELTGQLEDGEVFAVASPQSPLEVVLGQAQIFEPIEQALLGKASGDSATVWVSPRQGFGEHDSSKVHALPRNRLASDLEDRVGQRVKIRRADGEALRGRILSADSDRVVIDCNHPLAGHSMRFDIKVLKVSPHHTHDGVVE